jgi:hypothetical protein
MLANNLKTSCRFKICTMHAGAAQMLKCPPRRTSMLSGSERVGSADSEVPPEGGNAAGDAWPPLPPKIEASPFEGMTLGERQQSQALAQALTDKHPSPRQQGRPSPPRQQDHPSPRHERGSAGSSVTAEGFDEASAVVVNMPGAAVTIMRKPSNDSAELNAGHGPTLRRLVSMREQGHTDFTLEELAAEDEADAIEER